MSGAIIALIKCRNTSRTTFSQVCTFRFASAVRPSTLPASSRHEANEDYVG